MLGMVPSRWQHHGAGCCRAAVPACRGGRELIRVECPGRGRGDARAARAQAALGFRAAAVLEQRQGQMAAGLALPHLGGLGWAWRSWPCPQPCPGHRCCCLSGRGAGQGCPGLCAWLCGVAGGTHCPLPVLPTRPGLSEVFPSAQGISLALMFSHPVGSTWLCHHNGHPSQLVHTQ